MVFAGAEESACSRLARLDSKLSSVIVIRDLLATNVKRMNVDVKITDKENHGLY